MTFTSYPLQGCGGMARLLFVATHKICKVLLYILGVTAPGKQVAGFKILHYFVYLISAVTDLCVADCLPVLSVLPP